MSNKPCLLIMAGGTGGHVFPALAVADYLRDRGVDIQWMGTDKGIEAKVCPQNNIPLHTLNITGIRGKSITKFLTGPFAVAKAIAQAKRIIRQVQPQAVMGMGGYASGPGGIAAKLCGIPLIVHEQNAKPGSTNKVLSKIAQKVLCGFPNALPKGECVGNPVRDAFYQRAKVPTVVEDSIFRLLVLGGSLGAKALNEIVPSALALLPQDTAIQIVHQAGARTHAAAKAAYAPLVSQRVDWQISVREFIEDVALEMAQADLVICRAGALTVAELSVLGKPAILVPFPYAIDDHQTANARFLSDKGAAILRAESDLTKEQLAEDLRLLIAFPEKLNAMARAARLQEEKTATEKVAECCLEYLNV